MTRSAPSMCLGCFEYEGSKIPCPECGFRPGAQDIRNALTPGALLNRQYLVGRVLGQPGGFGITYLAWDIRLKTRVALKEFFPQDLVGRDRGSSEIIPNSEGAAAAFEHGLNQFMEEASRLAKFDHMNVVRVRTVFESHGSAYLVMDYIEGMTLAEYMRQEGGSLSEVVAVSIALPICDGLREVHAKGVLHRDIKPQNIYLTQKGRPILLDFGAARESLGERTKSMTAILTPGYAPLEQYHSGGDHGPWTDLYAVAATMYAMLTGDAPPPATSRTKDDPYRPPKGTSVRVRNAITKALAMEPAARQASVAEFQQELADIEIVRIDPPAPRPLSPAPTPWRKLAMAAAVVMGVGGGTWMLASRDSGANPPEPGRPSTDSIVPASFYQEEIRRRMAAGDVTRTLEGYERVGDLVEGNLGPLSNAEFEIQLAAGSDYRLRALCDGDCNDVDLYLFDPPAERPVASNIANDAEPVVEWYAAVDGAYRVRVRLITCRTRQCFYATAIYRRNHNARERQVDRVLSSQIAAQFLAGFRPVMGVASGTLGSSVRDTVSVELQQGVAYRIQGACDDRCTDLDLSANDPDGVEVAAHGDVDKVPVLNYTPTRSGTFQISVIMYACSADPCHYGLGVYAN